VDDRPSFGAATQLALAESNGYNIAMSETADLAHITSKTQTSLSEFKFMAVARDFMTHSKLVHWLQSEFELEHGHATLISRLILPDAIETKRLNKLFAKQFQGPKSDWLPAFDELASKLNHFGSDVRIVPSEEYVLFQRSGVNFGLMKVTNQRLTIGINLPGVPFTDTYGSSYTWTDLVTHSTDVSVFQQINNELISWLKAGYARAL